MEHLIFYIVSAIVYCVSAQKGEDLNITRDMIFNVSVRASAGFRRSKKILQNYGMTGGGGTGMGSG
ncbi:MAG: hypothetical protein AAGJ80_19725, partial [Cyanobacteria bacterium J06553_1]